MTNTITEAFAQVFNSETHHEFQKKAATTMSTVTRKTVMGAETCFFNRRGPGTAVTKARNGQVPLANPEHVKIPCQVTDHYFHEMVDDLDAKKQQVTERQEAAKTQAYGLARKHDQIVFTAASTTTLASGVAGPISLPRLLNATEALQANDVPWDGEVYGFLTTKAWGQLLSTVPQFSNADWVNVGQFENPYRAKDWLGVKWQMNTELPNHGTATAECMIWHKSAMGVGVQESVSTRFQFQLDYEAHRVGSRLAMGSCLIDPTGCIKIPVDDSAAIT